MEVTPEIYAWLSSLNIIDPFKSLEEDDMIGFIIPEKTLNLLFGGKYMDIILNNLQDSYNKFYKVKTNYISNISQLIPIQEGQEYIPNSTKYTNWKIIVEILNHFGLSYSEEDTNLLVNNDKQQLYGLITKIYNLFTQFLKYSSLDNHKKESNTNNNNINSNISANKRITKKHIISTSNNNSEKINKEKNDVDESKKVKEKSLNINELDPIKEYKRCNSTLEFFLLSLCKNLQMKPRQAIALISNNRKYLSIICHKGINNNFEVLKRWLNDLYNNKDIMIKLLQDSEDGINICYGMIGTAIKCSNPDISLQAAQLLNIIKYKIGMNWDWLASEGIDCFIFAIIRQNSNKLELMKILYDLIKDDTSYFFEETKKKLETEKNKIFEFFANIISISENLNNNFCLDLQNLIFDIMLKEQNDQSYSLSILSDSFFYFYPITEETINKIIIYFKGCIKSNIQNVFSTAVFQIFILMERFGKIKNKYAPHLYKNLVFLFLEEYDNEIKREVILDGFEHFLNNNIDIPIDILLEPYLNQLNTCKNYILCDFLFLLKMVEHPRIESKDILDIIQFILSVCLNNVIYSRTANLILSLIFEKKIIENVCTNSYDINEIEYKFVDFINTALDSYTTNLSKEEDKFILETPYDIMTENFTNVNMQIKETLIKSIKVYRKIKGCHSNSLLAMLWYYNDNDDIMCQIEELNRPIYEPMEDYYKRIEKEQEERDKKDFNKKVMTNLSKIHGNKMNILNSRQMLHEQKRIKEERIKKRLTEQRRIARVMSGIDVPPRAPILFSASKLKRSSSEIFNLSKNNLVYNLNKIETGKLNSNMLFAMSNATQNYKEKGIIKENSKLYSNLSIDYKSQNLKLRKNNSQINLIQNKNNDEIYKKFGTILSIDQQKLQNEVEKEYKYFQKMETFKMLIQKEGKFVNSSQSSLLSDRGTKFLLSKSSTDKIFGLPFNLEYEEDRELKAINGYNKEYKKNLKYYFKSYGNEAKKTITKSKYIKMLKDKGINKERLDYEEINLIIRRLFKENLNEFSFNQFINLLVQSSYLIYAKRRPTLTIGETYGILLKRFYLNNNAHKIALLRRKYEPVIDYLLELKQGKEAYNLPDGFKFVKKTSVKYNSRLAPHFIDILGEGRYICYQIIEDILFNIFNSSIIEPYVEISTEETIEIEPEKLHNWTPGLTMAYIDLDKKYKFHGIFAADALEDGLRKIIKNKKIDIKNNIDEESKEETTKEEHNFDMSFAKKDIKKKMELYRKIKKEKKELYWKMKKENMELYSKIMKEKNKNNKEKIKYVSDLNEEEKAKRHEKFEEVKKRREQKQEEKKNKILSEQQKKKEKETKKILAWIKFNKEQKPKLKEQFKAIVTKRNETLKTEKEKKEKELKMIKEYKEKSIANEDDKNYYKFEKSLNNTIKSLIKRNEIKEVFDKYNNHLKLIYDIYSKSSYNKISFYSKEVLRIQEFKQFLINFLVIGVIISPNQMIWIFNNISKVSQSERNNEMYLDFNDFILALCYLSIFSKIKSRARKILPKDIEDINAECIESFMKFLKLKIPFKRIDIEKMINERKNMTMKNILSIQHTLKKISKNENNKSVETNKVNENSQEKNGNEQINEETKDKDNINSKSNEGNNNENNQNKGSINKINEENKSSSNNGINIKNNNSGNEKQSNNKNMEKNVGKEENKAKNLNEKKSENNKSEEEEEYEYEEYEEEGE